MAKMRIQKALSDAGVISRRKAEELIAAGKITVNGHRAEPGNPVDTAKDIVVVEGKRVTFPRKKENLYIMLHKPRGYVTTTSDELGRRCVTELVEGVHERVYPIGRLDKNTEGLLLMTNDGQFANMMMHPSSHVTKTYRLTARPDITDEQAARLAAGVDIGEGVITQPAQVHVVEKEQGRVVLQITITEGKNRQIRRMCEAVGLEVARLKRVSVGPLRLGMLQPGQWRELTKAELLAVRNAGKPIEIPNAPGTGRDSQRYKGNKPDRAEKPGRTSDLNAGSHSFGTAVRRGERRKDGFVGKKEKGIPHLDDYSFKGGYRSDTGSTGAGGRSFSGGKTGRDDGFAESSGHTERKPYAGSKPYGKPGEKKPYAGSKPYSGEKSYATGAKKPSHQQTYKKPTDKR